MRKFRILGYVATVLGFALLLIALYARFYSATLPNFEEVTYPFLFIAVPFMVYGICMLIIGVVALSVPSKKKKWKQTSLTEIKETQPITQEVPKTTDSQQPKPRTVSKAEPPPPPLQPVQLDTRKVGIITVIFGSFLLFIAALAYAYSSSINFFGFSISTYPYRDYAFPIILCSIASFVTGFALIVYSKTK